MSDVTQQVAEQSAPSESELANQTELDASQVTAAEGEAEKQEQGEEKPKTFTQAEVDALIQKRLAKERRNEARRIEGELRKLQQSQNLQEPKRESFQDDDQFKQAQIRHEAEKLAQKLRDEEKAQEARERRSNTFQERAEKASERYADFDTVVSNPDLQINDGMAEFIAESDVGPDLAYYLGKNPDKASQIARMSVVQAARELTRIETELASKPKATPSKAPEPINPVGNRGKSSSSASPSDDDDIETWMQKERKRMRGG